MQQLQTFADRTARGSNQSGMRAYNERLVLSLIRRSGPTSKAEIARLTGLSAQTVSVIMRALEADSEIAVPEIIFQPHFGKKQVIEYEQDDRGGHGGGDIRLLNDAFRSAGEDPLERAADYVDGVNSILTGIAANESLKTGRPVNVATLLHP